MKTITTNNRTLLFVDVHEDADNFTVEDDKLYYSDKIFKDAGGGWEILPEGNYRYIATTDTITEEEAREIFPKTSETGEYYETYYIAVETGDLPIFPTSKIAFNNFLQHHSITGRHAIIEVL